MNSLYLAWRHIAYHRIRTLFLVLMITTVATVPLVASMVTAASERLLMSRAEATPFVFGPRDSPVDLALASLYFERSDTRSISLADFDWALSQRLGAVLPVHRRYSADGFPVVGTDIDYFLIRGLSLSDGRLPAVLGDAVIGAEVARSLDVEVGGTLVTSTDNLFDLSGSYPLRLEIVGVLQRSDGPDDRAVFVSIETGWVMDGLGHGHEDLQTASDAVILERAEGTVTANARLFEFAEITEENRSTFHFHGDPQNYALNALLVFPGNDRDAALLAGRVADQLPDRQIFRPNEVISRLVDQIFRVRDILNLVVALVAGAMVLAFVVIFGLSLQLRAREFDMVNRIGGDRWVVLRLVVAELFLLASASAALSAGIVLALSQWSEHLVRTMVL